MPEPGTTGLSGPCIQNSLSPQSRLLDPATLLGLPATTPDLHAISALVSSPAPEPFSSLTVPEILAATPSGSAVFYVLLIKAAGLETSGEIHGTVAKRISLAVHSRMTHDAFVYRFYKVLTLPKQPA